MSPNAAGKPLDELFAQFRNGNRLATDELIEALYPELKRIAASKMKNERGEHTWQPTALVNELYLELIKIKALRDPENQSDQEAFLSFAAFLMNRLLARHGRPLERKALKVEIEKGRHLAISGTETMAHVDRLLDRLATIDPKFRTVVELRVFGGLNGEEIASRLECSRKTVDRYWVFASRWLQKELSPRVAP